MGRLILVGAGPIGVAAATAAVEDGAVESVAAVVDPDDEPRREGSQRFACAGFARTDELWRGETDDWALAAFSSRAEVVEPEIVRLLGLGYHVVSTCEELASPDAARRERISALAHQEDRVVVVTGANPGFVMDRLVAVVAGAARRVRKIEVIRRVDTARRRGPLVSKTGRGLSTEDFAAGVSDGRIGHVGLDASARLVAEALGLPPTGAAQSIEPVIADGQVSGLHQTASLTADGVEIVLDLTMAWGIEPLDRVTVDGEPPLTIEIPGGYHGDDGTTAQIVDALRRGAALPPGLHTPIDIPLRR